MLSSITFDSGKTCRSNLIRSESVQGNKARHRIRLQVMGTADSVRVAVVLKGMLELQGKYKGVLLDQFGVLHDGRQTYPDAVSTVDELAAAGMKLLIISNSSRRSNGALNNLAKMGFTAESFCGAITSGEVTHSNLLTREGDFWKQLGSRCLHFTWGDRGAISLQGLGLQVVDNPDDADFILAHGTEALGHGDDVPPTPLTMSDMDTLMQRCAAKGGVPMIVANPDVVTVHGTELRVMPGTLAKKYMQMGGQVHLMGKPAPVIYEAAINMLNMQPHEIVAVGDSMEHDIAGAAGAGVDSVFIGGGIHANVVLQDGKINDHELQKLSLEYDSLPTYAMTWFRA